jgi:ferrous iron transport protein A
VCGCCCGEIHEESEKSRENGLRLRKLFRLFRRLRLLRRREGKGGSIMPITLLRPGETGVVKRISGAADTKRFLASLGFVDGSQVRVVSELCGNMILHIMDSRVAVNKEMAKHIIV